MRTSYRIIKFGFWASFKVLFKGRAFGVELVPRTGPVLLVANHQSFADPMLVGSFLPRECHFMARDSLFKKRLNARIISFVNAFPVNRTAADIGAFKESLRILRGGKALVAFPEGTRTLDGRIGQLHPGIFAIAKRANCPIVPTIVEGAFEAWPRERKYPRMLPVWVEYGTPIRPEELADLATKDAIGLLAGRFYRIQNRLRKRMGRDPIDYNLPLQEQADTASRAKEAS